MVIGGVRLDDGRIIVVADDEVRWFGPGGTYLQTLPARGEGPGEFRYISQVSHAGQNILIFGDPEYRKTATFSPGGKLLHSELLDFDKYRKLGRWMECQTAALPDGSRIDCLDDGSIPVTQLNRQPANGDPGPGLLWQRYRFYVAPAALDTKYALGVASEIEQFGYPSPRGTRFVIHPFYSKGKLAFGGDSLRIAIAENPAYDIQIWTPDGKLERIIRRERGRRSATEAERKDAIAAMGNWMRQMGDSSDPAALVAKMPVPDSLPAVEGLSFDPDGDLYVRRDYGLPSQTTTHFDVFAPTGVWLGTLTLPARTRILDAGNDALLVVHLDNDDVQHVEAYRVHKSAATPVAN
ncbi:MAG: hypothetical protein ACREL5_05050 [Gemmatimonadales bacterium]